MSRQGEVQLKWFNDEDDKIEHTFPAKNEVCNRCEGYGNHLNPSIGNHAYTMEEFHESFDEEQAEQYFKRGGIYDVSCEVCHGNKVVPVVDEERLSPEQKKLFEEYQEAEDRRLQDEAEERATYRAESGYRDD